MSFIQISHWQIHDDAGHRKYVNGDERERFLHAADDLRADIKALCHTLAYSGGRISEVLNLTIHHLDADRCTLTIKTLKRRRVVFRTVPIPEALVRMLLALPPHEDGRFWQLHRVTAWRHVKRAMTRVAIKGPMACPKGLRHGFGVRAAGRFVPLNVIQKWLGHSSGRTTAIYLDVMGPEERGFAVRMWMEGPYERRCEPQTERFSLIRRGSEQADRP